MHIREYIYNTEKAITKFTQTTHLYRNSLKNIKWNFVFSYTPLMTLILAYIVKITIPNNFQEVSAVAHSLKKSY